MTAQSILSAVDLRTHTLIWEVSCESSAISFYESCVSITENRSTSGRESSSLILGLTSHWRRCNSAKVINHLPKLRPHISSSLWAPKLLLRASDGCLVSGCSSPLGQVKPALTFPLLSLSPTSLIGHIPLTISFNFL